MDEQYTHNPEVAPGTAPGNSSWKQAAWIVLPVLVFFGLAETAARVREHWAPPMAVDAGQGFDPASLLFTSVGDGYMETNPDKRVSFQYQRFLREKAPGTLRIFALGGSSVNYLDYEFSQLKAALEQALTDRYKAVEVINCGGLSYGTHRLVLIASEIMEYDPDVVLIYSGHNEFEEVEQMHLAGLSHTRAQRVLGRSALYRYLRDTLARRRIARLEEAKAARDLATSVPDSSRSWMHVFTPEEIQERMQAYRANLDTIIRMCCDRGITVIIGTVPSNLWQPNLPGKEGALYEEAKALFNQGRYREGLEVGRRILREASPRHQSSDAENGIIRALAREHRIPLADVETAVIAAEPHGVPGETLFNDHCHLNPEGNRILRRLYQDKILEFLSS